MKKLAGVLFLAMLASAGNYTNGTYPIWRMFSQNELVFVQFQNLASGIVGGCHHAGAQFYFDGTTPKGKNFYAMLLAAKTAGQNVDVWFTESNSFGATTQCSNGNMPALIYGVGGYQ